MSDTEKSEWQIKREAAASVWETMTPHQQDSVLRMLKAWVPIRSRISELSSLEYDDLKDLDNAWYQLRYAIVDENLSVREWDL